MRTLKPIDVVIVGGGWTGLLMAKELGARTALRIVVLERGPQRNTEDYAGDMDELDYVDRSRMMQDLSQETITFRHGLRDRAVPLRQHGSFNSGTGVGGGGEHWGGLSPRVRPEGFRLLSHTVEKYGENRLPADHAIQDWGVTYEEMEPYYWRAEQMLGISGKAGNRRGKQVEGGNIFEGWRSAEFPTSPSKIPYFSAMFRDAAKSLGYHPYPTPTATHSQAYTNPDGITVPACEYCGFCVSYGCMIGAKAQPTNTLLPIIVKHSNVSIRTGSNVRRIVHNSGKPDGKVRGVTYVDHRGEELFQPADLVILSSWTMNNARMLLLSKAGDAYDPATGKGTLGRNLTNQVGFPSVTAFFDKPLNRFMGAGGVGIEIGDFGGDSFDHSNVSFIGGGGIAALSLGSHPIGTFGTVPSSVNQRWGSDWKKTATYYYDRNATINFIGEHLAYKTNYMDLDPNYKDRFGDPLLRTTITWRENERNMAEYMKAKMIEIARAMGAKELDASPPASYDSQSAPATHVHGGVIMSSSPDRGVLNPYLQHWQLPNLFVLGPSSFPQQTSDGPTLTIIAQAMRTAHAIVDRYLKSPGSLI